MSCSLTRLALIPVPRVEIAPDLFEQKLPHCALQLRGLQFLDITGGCIPCCVSWRCMRAHSAIQARGFDSFKEGLLRWQHSQFSAWTTIKNYIPLLLVNRGLRTDGAGSSDIENLSALTGLTALTGLVLNECSLGQLPPALSRLQRLRLLSLYSSLDDDLLDDEDEDEDEDGEGEEEEQV